MKAGNNTYYHNIITMRGTRYRNGVSAYVERLQGRSLHMPPCATTDRAFENAWWRSTAAHGGSDLTTKEKESPCRCRLAPANIGTKVHGVNRTFSTVTSVSQGKTNT